MKPMGYEELVREITDAYKGLTPQRVINVAKRKGLLNDWTITGMGPLHRNEYYIAYDVAKLRPGAKCIYKEDKDTLSQYRITVTPKDPSAIKIHY